MLPYFDAVYDKIDDRIRTAANDMLVNEKRREVSTRYLMEQKYRLHVKRDDGHVSEIQHQELDNELLALVAKKLSNIPGFRARNLEITYRYDSDRGLGIFTIVRS